MLLWHGPQLAHAGGSFLPTLARSIYGAPALVGGALLTFLGLSAFLPLLVVYQFGGLTFKPVGIFSGIAPNPKKVAVGSRFAAIRVTVLLATVALIAVIISLLALPPFTEKRPGRVGITHLLDVNTGSSKLLLAYPNDNKMTGLKNSLLDQGIVVEDCTVPLGLGWRECTGLCLNATLPPPVPVMPHTIESHSVDGKLQIDLTIYPPSNVSYVVFLLPWAPDDVTLCGTKLRADQAKDFLKLVFSHGHNITACTLHLTTLLSHSDDGSAIRMTVETLSVSPLVTSTIAALPAWLQPWGKGIQPGPAVRYETIPIPKP
jgi:hypothetical protein